MPPGYHVELVASEPLIQEPVALDWDLEGRLWAVEMPGFMADIRGSNEHDPIGRVVVLEDTNGDGRMDKRTVFADGLVLARSLKVLDRGVLVAEPPNVWLMHDTNGDLRMDTKEPSPIGTADSTAIRRTMPTASIGVSTTGCTPPAGQHSASAERRRLRGAGDPDAWRVGRDTGRRGTDVSQYE